jgi:type I restriction enzyme S subunit
MRINSGMVIFRPRHDVITDDFFYSFLISREFRDQVEALKTGSAQPQLPIRDLKLFEVELPPISDQKRIAEILSTFDDKIELNNKISKTLEQMAQAIFKEWFVKSEKTKVKSEKLSNLGKIICGKTPSKSNSEYFGGNIPFIKIPDMHNQIFILKTEDSLTQAGANSQKTKFIHKNSICVSCIATVGLVAITTEDSQTNQQINTIIPKSEIYLEFLYLALKIIKSDLMLIGSGGSTTLNINTNVFSNIEILTPEESIINKFHELVSPFFNKILQIYRENQKLAALRDLLLPKLMSGEIKV